MPLFPVRYRRFDEGESPLSCCIGPECPRIYLADVNLQGRRDVVERGSVRGGSGGRHFRARDRNEDTRSCSGIPPIITLGWWWCNVGISRTLNNRGLKLDNGVLLLAPDGSQAVLPERSEPRLRDLAPGVARRGIPQSKDDYIDHKFVCWETANGNFPFTAWIKHNIPLSSKSLISANQDVADQALFAGMGIGLHPETYAGKRTDLVEVLPPQPDWFVPLWLVTHVDLHRSTKVQALLQFIKDDRSLSWSRS